MRPHIILAVIALCLLVGCERQAQRGALEPVSVAPECNGMRVYGAHSGQTVTLGVETTTQPPRPIATLAWRQWPGEAHYRLAGTLGPTTVMDNAPNGNVAGMLRDGRFCVVRGAEDIFSGPAGACLQASSGPQPTLCVSVSGQ